MQQAPVPPVSTNWPAPGAFVVLFTKLSLTRYWIQGGWGAPEIFPGKPGGRGVQVAGFTQKRPRQSEYFGVAIKGDIADSPMANVLLVPSVMSRMRVFELMLNTPRSVAGIFCVFQQYWSLTPWQTAE